MTFQKLLKRQQRHKSANATFQVHVSIRPGSLVTLRCRRAAVACQQLRANVHLQDGKIKLERHLVLHYYEIHSVLQ